MKLAACNHCADLREEMSTLHITMHKFCCELLVSKNDPDQMEVLRHHLTNVVKRYLRLVGRWTKQDLAFEDAIVEPFMQDPNKWGNHCKMIWTMAKQTKLLTHESIPTLPVQSDP